MIKKKDLFIKTEGEGVLERRRKKERESHRGIPPPRGQKDCMEEWKLYVDTHILVRVRDVLTNAL